MQKKSCAFIDHIYHQKTKSTVFLLDFFKDQMAVTEFWIDDFSEENLRRLLQSDFDVYVVFQYDFLTSFLRSHGKRVISVPMYDGSGEVHPAHWALQSGALNLDFSQTLANIHRALSLDHVHRQYFPQAPRNAEQAYDAKRVFFWERRPSSGLSVRWLAKKVREWNEPPSHVHLHLSPDPTEYASIHTEFAAKLFPDSVVTTSTWFPAKADLVATLFKHNIFIASRPAEGIGFSFLEAMAAGMVVIGLDRPTLNEYIENGKNGYLLDRLGAPFPDPAPDEMARIGEAASQTTALGRRRWLDQMDELQERIEAYVEAPAPPAEFDIPPELAARMAYFFFNDYPAYIVECCRLAIGLERAPNKKMLRITKLARVSHRLARRPTTRAFVTSAYPVIINILNRRWL